MHFDFHSQDTHAESGASVNKVVFFAEKGSTKPSDEVVVVGPANLPEFTGKLAEVVPVYNLDGGGTFYVGLGKADQLDFKGVEKIGEALQAALKKRGRACIETPHVGIPNVTESDFAAHLAMGMKLATYRFEKYKSEGKKTPADALENVSIVCNDSAAAEQAQIKWQTKLAPQASGIQLHRDFMNEAANIQTPAQYAAEVQKHFEGKGRDDVTVEILDEAQIKEAGLELVMAVGQGSVEGPRIAIVKYKGNPEAEDQRPVMLVGKGVTMDTGGIQIKPGGSIESMKMDMGGSSAVFGAMESLIEGNAQANAVAYCFIVRNDVSGSCMYPGAIYKMLDGSTTKIGHTDAEGRLGLHNMIQFGALREDPSNIIDIATLTGASLVATGKHRAPFYGNSDTLKAQIEAASKVSGDKVWYFPIDDEVRESIKDKEADYRSVSTDPPPAPAGSIAAAAFLETAIINGNIKAPWAHIDAALMIYKQTYGPRLLAETVYNIADAAPEPVAA